MKVLGGTIGLGLFAFTSLLCAVSPSALFLILARGAQGVGGAIMFATSLALLAQEFDGRELEQEIDAGAGDIGATGQRAAGGKAAIGRHRIVRRLDQRDIGHGVQAQCLAGPVEREAWLHPQGR